MAPIEVPGLSPQETAALVERLKPTLLENWLALVYQEIPAAAEHSRPVLIDNMPGFLDDLIEALRTVDEDACATSQSCREHAEQRAKLGDYSLAQVVREHHLLRRVLLEVCEGQNTLDLKSRLIIHSSIDHGIRDAATRFLTTRQQELLEIDRRKNEFLALLAHELRTPLGAITNALQVLDLIGSNDERVVRQTSLAMRQTRHLARLAEDLLDVARVSRGSLELRLEIVDLGNLVRSAAEASRPILEGRQHHLHLRLPPDTLPVRCDPVRLEQVVSNLLSNAARYTPDGGNIFVSVTRTSGAESWAELRVRDDGIGMTADQLERVFDLYAQADPSSMKAREGLGIGLALVQRLVDTHGGTVMAHSEGSDRGSEFTVRLPVAGSTQETPPP